MISHYRKIWIISLLGLIGITLIWLLYRSMAKEHGVVNLPDYSASAKSDANWNDYLNIGEEIRELKKDWAHLETSPSDKENYQFEHRISQESLLTQTNQIKQMFVEEESFRKDNLDKAIVLYRDKLQQETDRELEARIAVLQNNNNKELGRQELNNKNAVEKYNEELANEYQVTLANLQLQLLLTDLSNSVKDPAGEKKKVQNQIDRIHQEMYDKVTARQRQLSAGFEDFKRQRQTALNTEIEKLKNEMTALVESRLNKYQESLEADFNQWRQQREQEIETVINLRQNRL